MFSNDMLFHVHAIYRVINSRIGVPRKLLFIWQTIYHIGVFIELGITSTIAYDISNDCDYALLRLTN